MLFWYIWSITVFAVIYLVAMYLVSFVTYPVNYDTSGQPCDISGELRRIWLLRYIMVIRLDSLQFISGEGLGLLKYNPSKLEVEFVFDPLCISPFYQFLAGLLTSPLSAHYPIFFSAHQPFLTLALSSHTFVRRIYGSFLGSSWSVAD